MDPFTFANINIYNEKADCWKESMKSVKDSR